GDYRILEEFKGTDLVGKKFVPHYDYYSIEKGKKAFVVVPGDFVTADEGTGVVTIAAYGEEDLAVMQKENIHIEMHVDEEGMLKPNVPKWGGKYYLDIDPWVLEDLQNRGLIYRVDSYTHTVPTCWRCHTRLIYAPQDAWYVNVQNLKEKLKITNDVVNWFPEHFKYGRYVKSLEHAPDWCISRSRYWGSPVPVWECPNGHRFVPGSIAELEKESGAKINDLHKPDIDKVTVICQQCGKTARRVPEVLDSWIEAGSASFAERHFPFDQAVKLEEFFPPDFIVEYTGQIRAWFYVLHVIATALYDSHAFKNVVVTGVILGTDGRKMSKNYGNYPDPKEMITKYGGDALRLYLMGSPVMHGEDIRISEEQYRMRVRGLMLILWNVYNFFVTYANVDHWEKKPGKSNAVLDRWITSLLQKLTGEVTEALEKYDTVKAIESIHNFVSDISTWYIRRSRDRVGPNGTDKENFYHTSLAVLTTLSKLLAPLAPFIAEEIYRNLTGEESVHLAFWPIADKTLIHEELEKNMVLVRKIVEAAHAKRKEAKIKVRQPLNELRMTNDELRDEELLDLIKQEVNVKRITVVDGKKFSVDLDLTITPQLKQEGDARELVRQVQILRKGKGCRIDEHISLLLPKSYQSFPEDLIAYVKRETLTSNVQWGETIELTGLVR
ncbi:MAG: Isoleucine-tRNA ligase, partial [Candidatus Azambacteria bacterium GW2011_GWA1_44_9]